MKKIAIYLNQPYPMVIKPWKSIVIASLLVFFVLFTLQPFGINRIEKVSKFIFLLGFMLVTAGVMSLQYYFFPLFCRKFYDETRWTVGKHIISTLITLLLIAVGNMAYFSITYPVQASIGTFIMSLVITIAVGIFPITFLAILRQNRLLAISLKETTKMNKSLSTKSVEALMVSPIILKGSSKESIETDANKLLVIEACANYVKVNFLHDGVVVQKMLRATIKQMEDATAAFPYIVKCHRAFLVNMNALSKVKGNSQGYHLVLNGVDSEIPVARAFNRELKNKIEMASRPK